MGGMIDLQALAARFSGLTVEQGRVPTVTVPAASFFALMKALRDDEGCRFDLLSNETAVDYPPERIRLVCHLVALARKEEVCVHVDLDRAAPVVDSLVPLWNAANFYEREVYDLYGVTFTGHPNLKRIMMDDDFVGWPLRKDFTSPDLVPRPER